MVVRGGGVAELADVPLPEPGAGQVRVRLEGCGVCGSDLPQWEGRPWFEYPRDPGAPGHEGWGWVDAVGPGVTGLHPGVRVAGLTYRAYAEHDLADADQLVVLPRTLGEHPFPGEPLACAVNVFRRARIATGQRVAVVGIGFLGAILAQLAVLQGATVVAVSRREAGLRRARDMGAAEATTLDQPPDPESFEVVVEAAGRQDTLDLAARLVRVRGRLVIAGFHQDGPRSVDMRSWNWRGIDVVNAHERDPARYLEAMRVAAQWTGESRLWPNPLYTHRYPLERADEAFRTASERPDDFMKALVLA
jgi:threonine dehydrogenase-like Zn-dependent dehydrogenase